MIHQFVNLFLHQSHRHPQGYQLVWSGQVSVPLGSVLCPLGYWNLVWVGFGLILSFLNSLFRSLKKHLKNLFWFLHFSKTNQTMIQFEIKLVYLNIGAVVNAKIYSFFHFEIELSLFVQIDFVLLAGAGVQKQVFV